MEYHEFPSEIRCLTLPKNFVNESFGVSKLSCMEIFLHKRGTSQLSVKSFLTQSTEELRSGTLLCFSKILVSRIVTDKRQISRLPVIFLFYRTKEFVGDFFLRSRKCRVSIRVRDNRGDITIFRRKYVVSQDREIS